VNLKWEGPEHSASGSGSMVNSVAVRETTDPHMSNGIVVVELLFGWFALGI